MTADNEGLLSRWSRRKLQAREVSEQEDKQLEQGQQSIVDEPEVVVTESLIDEVVEAEPEPVLTDADMPDIDTLHEDSDFTPFMSPGVSDKLRNLALKKMFHAPVFNIRDGLDEYDDDYTSFEPLGDIVTCDMKHQMELEAQKQLEAEMEEDDVQFEEQEEVNEPEPDDDDEKNIDPTETDITETDITEPLPQLDEQQQSSASSYSESNPNTVEYK
jgi:hypothetical protein